MIRGEAAEGGDMGQEHRVILCADDYALTDGVSTGIEELADAERLSATSALVTGPHWAEHGARLARRRDRLVLGLHINLTLGRPLSPGMALAPSGTFPSATTLLRNGIAGRLDPNEIKLEVRRQIDRFEEVAGQPPDMIDGHQHAHALPGVRQPVLTALAERFPEHKPLLRDPADHLTAIVGRRASLGKALSLGLLTRPFGARARGLGFPTNRGFSGFSAFDDRIPYGDELSRNLAHTGTRHMIMCHPGYPDAELASLDPVVGRRLSELETLKSMPDLPSLIWHPRRSRATGHIEWPGRG